MEIFFAGGGGGDFFKLLLTGGGGGCFLTLFIVDVYEPLVFLNFALPIERVFDLAGEEERPSYVCLSEELWTEEIVLSANTSVLTGRRLHCEGLANRNRSSAPQAALLMPSISCPDVPWPKAGPYCEGTILTLRTWSHSSPSCWG